MEVRSCVDSVVYLVRIVIEGSFFIRDFLIMPIMAQPEQRSAETDVVYLTIRHKMKTVMFFCKETDTIHKVKVRNRSFGLLTVKERLKELRFFKSTRIHIFSQLMEEFHKRRSNQCS